MNARMLSVLLMYIFFGTLLFTSCSDEEEIYDPREHSGWGYFEGTVNGKKVSVKNDVHNSFLSYTPQREEWDPNVVKGIAIGIALNEAEHIGISFYRLTEGMRFVTSAVDTDYNSDGIHFWHTIKPEDSYSYDIVYISKKDKPFKIEITNLTYYDTSNFVRVSARLDGVLYRTTNPQDSIVIRGSFEVR